MRAFTLPLTVLFVFPAVSSGQAAGGSGFNRPPAGVDEALRARVLEFYRLEQEGRFRQAEGLVCEESRDRYYDMEKRRWTSVELIQTLYEDNFTKARASMALGTTMNTFSGPLPVKAPLTSLWHLEKGKWCRYIPEPSRDGVASPFGIMRPAAPGGKPQTPFAGAPPVPQDPGQLNAMVRLSKTSVTLPAGGGSESVEIFNGMPGRIELRLACPDVVGLTCELSTDSVARQGKAALVLKYSGGQAPPAPAEVRLLVEPLGTRKHVRVHFQ